MFGTTTISSTNFNQGGFGFNQGGFGGGFQAAQQVGGGLANPFGLFPQPTKTYDQTQYLLIYDYWGTDVKSFKSLEESLNYLQQQGNSSYFKNIIIVHENKIVFTKKNTQDDLFYIIGFAISKGALELKPSLKRNYVIYYDANDGSKIKIQKWANNNPDEALKYYDSLSEALFKSKVFIQDWKVIKTQGDLKKSFTCIGSHFD